MTHALQPHTIYKVYFIPPSIVKKNIGMKQTEYIIKETLSDFYNISETQIVILRNENGKPYSQNINIAYNLSHSGDIIFSCFSPMVKNIGCDIQKVSSKYSIHEIMEYYFYQDEINYINNNNIDFFLFWTLKESYIKYLGKSIFDIKSLGSILPFLDKFDAYSLSYNNLKYFLSIYPATTNIKIISPLMLHKELLSMPQLFQ